MFFFSRHVAVLCCVLLFLYKMEIPSEAKRNGKKYGHVIIFPCNPFGFSLNSDMFIVIQCFEIKSIEDIGDGTIVFRFHNNIIKCFTFYIFLTFCSNDIEKKIKNTPILKHTHTHTNHTEKNTVGENGDRVFMFEDMELNVAIQKRNISSIRVNGFDE